MRIFQQGNSPYSCLLLWGIREVAWDWRAVGSWSLWIYRKLQLPAVSALDGFHIHVNSQLKANFSFKKKFTVNNLALTSYNKRFLYAAVILFLIQSEFTGWYRSGLWHELGTKEILVIAGQTSVWAGDVTLLSWREWWEDVTELCWLTLCSPPQAENGCMFEDSPYWSGGCELFKDINNCAILASCWRSFSASLARNSSNLGSLAVFSFN